MTSPEDNEIEVKVLDIDVSAVEEKLRAVGCVYQGREFQQNYMFDYPDRRLYEQQDGSYVRLRRRHFLDQKRSEILLTYKQTLSREKYKIADETETRVDDFEQMHRFLGLMGLEEVRSDEKLRATYTYKDLHFEIDEWAGLPPYLEVEGSSEEKVAEGLALLEFTLKDATAMNLREVLAKYKIKASHLHFKDFGREIL